MWGSSGVKRFLSSPYPRTRNWTPPMKCLAAVINVYIYVYSLHDTCIIDTEQYKCSVLVYFSPSMLCEYVWHAFIFAIWFIHCPQARLQHPEVQLPWLEIYVIWCSTMWYQMSAWYISVYLILHQMQVGTYCITLLTSLADSSSLQLNCVQYFSISCFHRLYLAQWCPGTWIAWSHFRALELNPRWDALHDLLRFRYAKDATLVISSCHDRTWGFHRFSTQEIVNLLSAGILGLSRMWFWVGNALSSKLGEVLLNFFPACHVVETSESKDRSSNSLDGQIRCLDLFHSRLLQKHVWDISRCCRPSYWGATWQAAVKSDMNQHLHCQGWKVSPATWRKSHRSGWLSFCHKMKLSLQLSSSLWLLVLLIKSSSHIGCM